MPAPYDYTLGQVPNPAQSFLQGIQTVDALRQREQQIADAEKARKAQEAFRTMQTEYWNTPNPTLQQTMRLASMLPKDQAEMLFKGVEAQDKAKTQANIALGGQVLSSLLAGNKDTAVNMLRERATAATNSGDQAGSQQWDALAKQIEIAKPEESFKIFAPFMAASGEEGRKMMESVYAAQKQPSEQREAAAKAKKADADAIIAEAQAKFAPDKFGAELNLTNEQIAAAKSARRASEAAASASGAAAKRANAEAEQISAGIIPSDKRPEAEAKFRKEYSDQTKGYQDVKSAYGRILAVSDPKTPDEEAAADLALVFNYMKMQDPGSTVNTGEFANAQNAAGVPDRLRNAYNNLVTGGRLNPTQRKAFKGQAENLYKVAGQQETIVRTGIERIAKGYGLKTENIFYTPTEVAPVALGAPAANSVTVGDKTYTRPANFTDAQWNAYKQSVGAR